MQQLSMRNYPLSSEVLSLGKYIPRGEDFLASENKKEGNFTVVSTIPISSPPPFSTISTSTTTTAAQQLQAEKQLEAQQAQLKPNCCRRYLGIILGLLQCVAFSVSILIVKALPQYHPYSISLWRFVVIFICSITFVLYYAGFKKKPIFDGIWPWADADKRKTFISLLLRGIVGTTAAVLLYASLQYMEAADCTVIAFSSPIVVTVIAFLFLREKCGVVPIFSALLALVGVIIIARPPFLTGSEAFDYELMVGTIIAFASMVCTSSVFVILRYLRKLNFSIVTTAFGLIGTIECGILCASIQRLDIPATAWDWLLVLGIGFTSFLGQLLMTSACKFESASVVSLTRTCEVIFAFIWQFIFLNVQPDVFSILGALIVVSGVVLAALRKWVSEQADESEIKRRLWFLLT